MTTQAFADVGDEELMALCRDGQEQAFTALYERHRQRIINHAQRLLQDPEEAQDVLQETFRYLFSKLDEYRPTAKFTTYCYTIVRHQCLNIIEKRRRRQTHTMGDTPFDPAAPDPAPPERAEQQELAGRLRLALARLSPAHREVVALRLLEGLSVEDVARVCECPEGTVKSRLHHALEKLRAALGGGNGGNE